MNTNDEDKVWVLAKEEWEMGNREKFMRNGEMQTRIVQIQ